jgi:chemotaxis protein methyltransferase CheR
VLEEESLLDRCMIYATDGSNLAIEEAKAGEFEIASESELDRALSATGSIRGIAAFGDVGKRTLTFHEGIKRNIVFAQHDLVGDSSLNEFHVILSRGVLGQFNRTLQFKVYGLLVSSLLRLGFLCLGPEETLRTTPYEKIFNPLPGAEAIYRRMR